MGQPDSILPDPGNPLAFDRYAYVFNNPIKYIDPSGHICIEFGRGTTCTEDADSGDVWITNTYWVSRNAEYGNMNDAVRQDLFFSLMFGGSGLNNNWTGSDWTRYHGNKRRFWDNPHQWDGADQGWNLFATHAGALASNFDRGEQDLFGRAFGLMFAGIPYSSSWTKAAISVAGGPHDLSFLNEGNQGLASEYLDTILPTTNQSHHYAGLFCLGQFSGRILGVIVSHLREIDNNNVGDMLLGDIAVGDGFAFGYQLREPSHIVALIASLTEYYEPTGVLPNSRR